MARIALDGTKDPNPAKVEAEKLKSGFVISYAKCLDLIASAQDIPIAGRIFERVDFNPDDFVPIMLPR